MMSSNMSNIKEKAGASPLSMPVQRYVDNIPMELWYQSNWVLWKLEEHEGKLRKVPYMTYDERAKTSDDCWYKLLTALSMYEAVPGSYTGVGYVFDGKPDSSGLVIVGIDIDAHGGELSQEAQQVITSFSGTYIERSQSGKGVHILIKVRADALKGLTAHRHGAYEAYWNRRYFALTADIVGEPNNTEERYEVLDKTETFLHFYRRYIKCEESPKTEITDERCEFGQAAADEYNNCTLTDDDVISLLRRKPQHAALYDGVSNSVAGGGNDVSAGDAALCTILAFYTNKDAAQIDRLFRMSGRMRPKWNEKHAADGRTYGELTIDNAIAYCSTVYTGVDYYNLHAVDAFEAFEDAADCPDGAASQADEPKKWTGWPFCNSRGAGDKRILKNYKALFEFLGYDFRMNEISHEVEKADSLGIKTHYYSLDVLGTQIVSICARLGMVTDKSTVIDAIEAIASRNSYNPLADYFKDCAAKCPEDGGIKKFCDTIHMKGTPENISFRRELIRRWFIQAVYLANNTPDGRYKPAGCLVFQGLQGIGKSRLASWLMPVRDLFLGERGLNLTNKDSLMENFSVGLLELSEFRQDVKTIAALKAIITAGMHKYRVPYARRAKVYPCRTSIIITTNEEQFLIDTTGNRRFWILPIVSIDWGALQAMNPAEIWGEAYRAYTAGAAYWLDGVEIAHLDDISREYQDVSNVAQTLLEVLDFDAAPAKWKERTATEIYRALFSERGRESVKSVARGLKELVLKGSLSAPKYRHGRGAAKLYLIPPIRNEYIMIESEDDTR